MCLLSRSNFIRDSFAVIEVVVKSAELGNQVVRKLPLVTTMSDRLLDTLFGPADDWDYVSTTSPATPPPVVC